MEEKDLKKLLEDALSEPYGEQEEKLLSSMRDEASNDELRRIVQEVERMGYHNDKLYRLPRTATAMT